MAISYAVTIPAGRAHLFKAIPLDTVRQVARLERGHEELARLEPASYAADFDGEFVGQNPGDINDGSLISYLSVGSKAVAFPGLYLGAQHVDEVHVDWMDAWQPQEYVIEARDTLAEAWNTVNGRAVPQGFTGHHEFEAGMTRNWWRVRIVKPNDSQHQLVEMRFYGKAGAEQTRRILTFSGLEVSDDRFGTSVRNISQDPIEVQLIYG